MNDFEQFASKLERIGALVDALGTLITDFNEAGIDSTHLQDELEQLKSHGYNEIKAFGEKR
jgi:hypothetical protein